MHIDTFLDVKQKQAKEGNEFWQLFELEVVFNLRMDGAHRRACVHLAFHVVLI